MIGILVPMPEEIEMILSQMIVSEKRTIGMRDFFVGTLEGKPCVIALSRIGKVASAVTAATMIREFDVKLLILTGAAGAIDPRLKIGDMVVARDTVQHDMDCSPLFPRFEAPLLGISRFPCEPHFVKMAVSAFKGLVVDGKLNFISPDVTLEFHLEDVKVYSGLVGSGDQFINSGMKSQELHDALPEILCVEMEAGAVGQVCFEHGTPYIVLRTISDYANGNADVIQLGMDRLIYANRLYC
ncbi:MAG: 5'-methylthioadenosine/adenosylhomocysteine nucleosidase, partial [Cytophagales bacterium]|nr:5'-methylthioadenosine/adenosylhomocysteine nucleosidase [Cytophagales bacterium]